MRPEPDDRHRQTDDAGHIKELLREFALEQGFQRVGFAPARIPQHWPAFERWLERDHHADMYWMERAPHKRVDAATSLSDAATVITCGLNYYQGDPGKAAWNEGVIASYARGEDYHRVLGRMLDAVSQFAADRFGIPTKRYTDTGPLLEKPFGAESGLGWIGKHSNLISQQGSSWFFLGEILLPLALERDQPVAGRCGSCVACIDACPTGAIVEPYVVDSRRCISYLTIELRTAIPRHLRRGVGNRIFGCDDCQDVCPWNRFAQKSDLATFFPSLNGSLSSMELTRMLALSEQEFLDLTRGSAIRRAKYAGFLRNVAVALGNSGEARAVPALKKALNHSHSLVRSHVAWALGEIKGISARLALEQRLGVENEDATREEITFALTRFESTGS